MGTAAAAQLQAEHELENTPVKVGNVSRWRRKAAPTAKAKAEADHHAQLAEIKAHFQEASAWFCDHGGAAISLPMELTRPSTLSGTRAGRLV